MVPNLLPAQPAGNTTKTPAPKTDTLFPTDAGRQVSARVSAFLTSDATAKSAGERPKGPPPPGEMGPAGGGARQSEATGETATALLLLDTGAHEDAATDEVDEDTKTQTTAILFDEARTYYPTSIY